VQAFFAKQGNISEGRFASTHGGDAFSKELVKNHMFGSSGLNLVFEGLLLGVSLHLRVRTTSSNPRKSDSESAAPAHNAKEAPLCFVGSQRYRRSPDEGQEEGFRGREG
jgi:hypothetical protein